MTYFKKTIRTFQQKTYNFKQLYNYGINRLYAREYSKKELFEKMKKYQPDIKIIQDVLLLLENNGYLSDKRKAQSIINHYSNKESFSKISTRLKYLGISSDIIDELFDSNIQKENDSITIILNLLEKKFKKYDENNYLKMVRFLSQKGFSYDDIKKSILLFKEE
jgi:regulatory protein